MLPVHHVVQLLLSQPADTVEFPLYLTLFWGFCPALIAFLVTTYRHGIRGSKVLLLVGLLGFIYGLWFVNSKVLALPDESGPTTTIVGGLGASWIVVLLLLRGPTDDSSRE